MGVALRSPVGVVGMALEQLGSGGADHEQRHALGPIGQVLQEGEHRLIGPVQVLEHEHGGVLLGDVLQEPPPGREQLLALGGGGGLDPEQRQQALAEPGTFVAFGKDRVELGRGDGGCVGLQDPGVGLQDLPQRPERDALPVGQAPSLTPGDEVGFGVDVAEELGDDPALAEPRLAHDRDELDRGRRHGLVEDALQQRQVDLAADERGVVGPGEVGAEARPGVPSRGRPAPARTCP